MIENKFASDQTKRFSGLPNYPREREAQMEIAIALKFFPTEQHVRKFVDDWLASEQVCPLPAVIRKAAHEVRERDSTQWLDAKKCPDCNGSGFRLEKRRSRPLPGMNLREYDFAVKCDHNGAA